MMDITRKFTFSAAHHLTDYYGKCERVHGHTYELLVTVTGKPAKNGMVVDFSLLKAVVEENVLSKFDHRDLNTLFKNPTAENIAIFTWKALSPIGKLLSLKAKDPKFYKYMEEKYVEITGGKSKISDYSRVRLKEIVLFEGANSYVRYAGN